MPDSPLIAAGAEVQPTATAPLHTNEFFTGLWTQGNPLGPGAVPYLYQKFYSAARFERLVGGQNCEITTRLTLRRRPGQSVYNAGPFPVPNRFYEFRAFDAAGEDIHILASFDATVRDVTGPATNLVLWNKNAAAGRTSFQSVGNICYFADGVDAKKWVRSKLSWTANTLYNPGDFIVDTNNNLQLAMGTQTATIVNVQVQAQHVGKLVTIFFDPSTPLKIEDNITLTLAGMTTVPALNGLTPSTALVISSTQVQFRGLFLGVPVTGFSAETGTATTGTGISGAGPGQPAWNVTPSLATQDGGNQWTNLGPSVSNWGFAAPVQTPTVTQSLAPSIYADWAASTWYAPLFVIVDSNNNVQQLITAGITGGAPPAWNVVVGGTTNDNTAVWKNLGPEAWVANTAYTVGQTISVTWTFQITFYETTDTPPYHQQVTETVTQSAFFQCTVAGVTDFNAPAWSNGLNTTTTDNTVTWKNLGPPKTWATFGAAATLSLATKIRDANGNLQAPTLLGETGAAAPVWAATVNTLTRDTAGANDQVWNCLGPFSPANTGAWIYAYSGKNSITGHISTASQPSLPITVAGGNLAVIQGLGPTDPQEDVIVLWRTQQGGSTLVYADAFPNPGAGSTWIYTDTTPDSGLNLLITAPIDSVNNPPPAGFTPQCYYLNRIWGFVNNVLYYSGGPATITGSGNESFPPLNQFQFPSNGVTCWPTSIGLMIYTSSDIWCVLGKGTTSSPFYVVNFQAGVGLGNQDAIAVNGSTAYGMLTSGQVVSMDPGAGEVEVGFPIGDQFNTLYNPATAYLAWHQGSSADMALYVADGAAGWFRMAAVAAPESGNVWSPRALITAGVKAIASVEVSPGVKRLLVGSATNGQPIMMRDLTTNEDNGTSYTVAATLGSIVMAQPGTTAGLQFITTEEVAIAGSSPCQASVLIDEIVGSFIPLRNTSLDPPNLPASKSVVATRFWATQDPNTVQKMRHMQTQISWLAENYANELLTYTIFGRLPEKARK